MFCSNCGHNVAGRQGGFCPKCGTQIDRGAPTTTPQTSMNLQSSAHTATKSLITGARLKQILIGVLAVAVLVVGLNIVLNRGGSGLVGTWAHEDYPEIEFTFFSDGTYICDEWAPGTYSAEGNILLLKLGNTQDRIIRYEFKISGRKLSLKRVSSSVDAAPTDIYIKK